MKNLSLFALVALVLVVALAACGGGKTDVVPTEVSHVQMCRPDTSSTPGLLSGCFAMCLCLAPAGCIRSRMSKFVDTTPGRVIHVGDDQQWA